MSGVVDFFDKGFTSPSQGNNEQGGQVKHLKRPAKVVILKKVKAFPEPGTLEFEYNFQPKTLLDGTGQFESSDWARFQQDYAEFLQPTSIPAFQGLLSSRSILIPNRKLNSYTTNPGAFVSYKGLNTRLYYWYQLTIENESASNKLGTFDTLTNPLIGGITNISVERDIESGSSASFTLKNPLEVFCFKKNPLRRGQPVIEPLDQVQIWLPDVFDRLIPVFVGLVTEVIPQTTLGNSLNSTLQVFCEDNLKTLKMNRINLRPSANMLEAKAFVATTSIPFAEMRPHEILKKVFAEAYCDQYTQPGTLEKLHELRYPLRTTTSQTVLTENAREEINLRNSLVDESSNYIMSRYAPGDNLKLIAAQKTIASLNSVKLPDVSLDQKKAKALEAANSITPKSIEGYLTPNFNDREPVFSITGLDQPVYQIQFVRDWDFFVSEWGTNFSLAQEIAQKVFFELYTTPTGLVRFRPFNTALPTNLPMVDLYITRSQDSITDQTNPEDSRPSSLYKLSRALITSERYSDTDRSIYTIAYTRGQYQYADLGATPWLVQATVDSAKLRKFGARVAPQQNVFNLTDAKALRTYGKAILDRLNADKLTGTVTMKGDARLDIGNYCYLDWRATCYYIASISHTYNVGSGYDQSLSLRYGRRPIALTKTRTKEEVSRAEGLGLNDLATFLKEKEFALVYKEMLKTNDLDPITGIPLDTTADEATRLKAGAPIAEVDGIEGMKQQLRLDSPSLAFSNSTVRGELKDLTIQSPLVLDGFVWEPLSDLIYQQAVDAEKAFRGIEKLNQELLQGRAI